MIAVDETWVTRFRDSLPDSYRRRHGERDIALHAEVSRSRDGQITRVGIIPPLRGQLGVCVVANDSPGVFSCIAAAIRLQGYDIVHAEAYTRQTDDGGKEVLDLFRLQEQPGRANGRAGSDVAAAISATLSDLLEGRLDPDAALPDVGSSPHGEGHDTRVRFIEDDGGALSTLEVETDDRSGLLLTLARALAEQNVTIVSSEVHTRRGRVCDRFTVAEADGSAISEARRLELQVTVLGAIETPVFRG